MGIQVNESVLVVVKVETQQGRTTKHDRKKPICLTCPADADGNPRPWSDACKGEDHQRKQDDLVSITDQAPEEATSMRKLTGEAYRAFGFAQLSLGRQVFLIDASQRELVETTLKDLREKFDAANAGYKVCRIRFFPLVIDIKPGQAHEETMASIHGEIQQAVKEVLDALESGDPVKIRDAGTATKNLAGLLDEKASKQVGMLNETARATAKALVKAAKMTDDEADKAREDSRKEANRFRSIFSEVFDIKDTAQPAEQAAEPEVVEPEPIAQS